MMESIGNWNFMNFYVDEKATPAQRKALEAIPKATSPPAVPPEKIRIRTSRSPGRSTATSTS